MNGGSSRPPEPAVDAVLVAIREAIVAVTGSSLVGLYLFGSLAAGDFDAASAISTC
jgi:predicted nucleotidyltransferase